MQCQIKSKYRGAWQPCTLALDAENTALLLTRGGKAKQLPLPAVTRCELAQGSEVLLLQAGERTYEVRGGRLAQLVELFKLWTFFRDYKEVPEQKMQKPRVLDYHARAAALRRQKDQRTAAEEEQRAVRGKEEEEARGREVVEFESYYKGADWRRDTEEGGLLFVNEEKKSLQPKIIKFLISKFISTGSFMGISFPVFAMKPESILETYCRCFSLAPRLLTGLKNPIERLKAFNAVLLACSLRFIDIDKSFNPTIGETFQTEVDGCTMAAEQVSHHPPVSAFLLVGEGFELHGCLEVQASMGFNSARGRFYGDIVVEYADGGRLVGRLPCGVLHGYLFGRYVFYPDGASYCYDPANQLLCSYRVTHQDLMEGYLAKLNRRTWLEFLLLVEGTPTARQRERKFESFEHVGEEHCEKVYARVRAQWTKEIRYDEELYLDYEDESSRPPKLARREPPLLLPSDSRYRRDIQLRANERMEDSQAEKEAIEQEERRRRKLREKFAEQSGS